MHYAFEGVVRTLGTLAFGTLQTAFNNEIVDEITPMRTAYTGKSRVNSRPREATRPLFWGAKYS